LRRRITYFAVLAVALCVFTVVVVMTVLTGLVSDFKQKNHDFTGDCVVGTESLVGFAYYEDFVAKLEASEFVASVSEVIKSYALLSPRGRDLNVGVEIMGVDPARHSRTTGFGKTLHYTRNEALRREIKAASDIDHEKLAAEGHIDLEGIHSFLNGDTTLQAESIDAIAEHLGVQIDVSRAFEASYDPDLPGCVLGIDLALQRDSNSRYSYGANPSRIGFSITCFPLTAKGASAGAGAGVVNTKTFYYSDHSQSGLARVDSSLVYLPFEQAQLLCGMAGPTKRINAIHIKFKPDVELEAGRREIERMWTRFKEEKAGESQAYLLDTVSVQNWKSYRRMFIAAMEKEQTMMTAMFGFVGIVTVFIVFVVFYMLISHKSKDIGILKSIGVSNADIIEMFAGFAFMVGLLGSCIGLCGGWLFLAKINRIEGWLFERFGWQLWDRTIYAIGDIPSRASPKVLGVIVFSAILACLVGALVPSWQTARSKPIDALQVNQL